MGKRDQWGWGRCLKKKPSQILMISTDQNKHRSKFHNETYYLIHKLKIEFSKQLVFWPHFCGSGTWVAVVTESDEDHLWIGLIN